MKPLTEKQSRFINAYMGPARGNATKAAELAGYSGHPKALAVIGSDNLRKPNIVKALQGMAKKSPLVAGRKRIQTWLTEVMDGKSEGNEKAPSMKDRLRAAELLIRTQGLDKQVVEHTGPKGGPLQVKTIAVPIKKVKRDDDSET